MKKRDYKEKRKEYKKEVIAEGKDPNGYLQDAFDSGIDESQDGKATNQQSDSSSML